jgi:sterol desaturase/sphingolipid hydroxylase (fatty acid hydroxylase superfamily)
MAQQTSNGSPLTAENFIVRMSTTRWNYWAEFGLDIPIGVVLISIGLRRGAAHWEAAILAILSGLVLFSLLEYVIHRWLFHGPASLFSKGHGAHHENPMGYDALPFFLPAVFLLGLLGVFVLLMPSTYAFLLSGIMALGYVTYGLSHFAIHHVHFRNHFSVRWAGNHRIHHNHPANNFGVTTPLWDLLLGTKYISAQKRI